MEANSLQERIAAARTVDERVAMAASMTPTDRPFVWWFAISTRKAKALTKAIPGARREQKGPILTM